MIGKYCLTAFAALVFASSAQADLLVVHYNSGRAVFVGDGLGLTSWKLNDHGHYGAPLGFCIGESTCYSGDSQSTSGYQLYDEEHGGFDGPFIDSPTGYADLSLDLSSSSPAFYSFLFGSGDRSYAVNTGTDQFSISFDWAYENGGTYSPADFRDAPTITGLQIYPDVPVPEPAAAAIMMLGVVTTLRCRARARS